MTRSSSRTEDQGGAGGPGRERKGWVNSSFLPDISISLRHSLGSAQAARSRDECSMIMFNMVKRAVRSELFRHCSSRPCNYSGIDLPRVTRTRVKGADR